MAENGTVAYVTALPQCDLCKADVANGKRKTINDAMYDGGLNFTSSWAYMCQEHFMFYGRGIGTGLGQKLVVRNDN